MKSEFPLDRDKKFLKAMRIVPYSIESQEATVTEGENRKLSDNVEGLRLMMRAQEAIASKRARVIALKEYEIEQLQELLERKERQIEKLIDVISKRL